MNLFRVARSFYLHRYDLYMMLRVISAANGDGYINTLFVDGVYHKSGIVVSKGLVFGLSVGSVEKKSILTRMRTDNCNGIKRWKKISTAD